MSLIVNCSLLSAVIVAIFSIAAHGDTIAVQNHATGESYVLDDNPSNREMVKNIQLELSNGKLVTVYSDQLLRGTYVFVNESVCYALRKNRYVKEYVVSDDRKTIALLVYRGSSKSSAGWYSSLIVITLSDGTVPEGTVAIADVLSSEYLRTISERRMEIVRLGNINDFPNVSLEMLIQEKKANPSRILYNWQTWNAKEEKIIDFSSRITGPNNEPLINDPKWTPAELLAD